MTSWPFQTAKNQFSQLIDQAQSEGPQTITRHGIAIAMVIPLAAPKKITAPPQRLGDFLLASPLRNSELMLERPFPHTGL